jgi:ElaB/YqjD/DUF883 family membrane-anchored ribosome-binding protein
VIVVAASPTVEAAARAVDLCVDAFLILPLDREGFKAAVGRAIRNRQREQIVAQVRDHLQQCVAELGQVVASNADLRPQQRGKVPPLTIRTLAWCLSELLTYSSPTSRSECPDLCRILDCPHRSALRDGLEDAVQVLLRTKNSFKSKEIASLRVRLEQLLGHSRTESARQPQLAAVRGG